MKVFLSLVWTKKRRSRVEGAAAILDKISKDETYARAVLRRLKARKPSKESSLQAPEENENPNP